MYRAYSSLGEAFLIKAIHTSSLTCSSTALYAVAVQIVVCIVIKPTVHMTEDKLTDRPLRSFAAATYLLTPTANAC